MYQKYGNYIGGHWRRGKKADRHPVICPTNEQSLGLAPHATKADTMAAIDAAEHGLRLWSQSSAYQRAEALHKIADRMLARSQEAALMIVYETGKLLTTAEREWGLAIEQFRWFAEESRRIYGRIIESRAANGRFEIHHQPVGIVAAFTAWNFPAALVARKMAPALAAGCSVIVRPSLQTPGVVMLMMDCCRVANLPIGTVNLVNGPTDTTYQVLMADKRVRKVSLTGSTHVGQQMIRDAAATLKRTSMELGGNAPLIVFDDADVDTALTLAVPTKFANAGQVCVTPDRFYIHKHVYDRFVAGFVAKTKAIKLGDSLQDKTVGMGPLISAARRDAIANIVANAIDQGAHLAAGGKRPDEFNKGFFFEPTVLSECSDDMDVMAKENFGPIAAISRFTDEDEILARANDCDMGLAAYCFTKDPARARRMVAGLKAGMVGINGFALAAAEAPFGGIGFSGMGREGGIEAIRDYLDVKSSQMVWN